jgi:ABC-type lipoprotein release transport system permease subunit
MFNHFLTALRSCRLNGFGSIFAICVGVGVALGVALDNVAVGVALGVALGVAFSRRAS